MSVSLKSMLNIPHGSSLRDIHTLYKGVKKVLTSHRICRHAFAFQARKCVKYKKKPKSLYWPSYIILRTGCTCGPKVAKDKSIEANPKTRTQLFLSRIVSKPFFGVYDQDVIEAAYALTATNKTLSVFVHEVTLQSFNSRRMIGDCNFK